MSIRTLIAATTIASAGVLSLALPTVAAAQDAGYPGGGRYIPGPPWGATTSPEAGAYVPGSSGGPYAYSGYTRYNRNWR
jgi:hypothetical protein